MADTTVILRPRCPLCGGEPLGVGPKDLPPAPCLLCEQALSEVTARMDSYHAVAAREAILKFARVRNLSRIKVRE